MSSFSNHATSASETEALMAHAVRSLGSSLCHDFASPLTALITGIDLLRTTKNPQEIYALVDKSLAMLRRTLELNRQAYGTSHNKLAGESLYMLIQNYADSRAGLTLQWELDPRQDQGISPQIWHVLPTAFTCFMALNSRAHSLTIQRTTSSPQGISLVTPRPANLNTDWEHLGQEFSVYHLSNLKHPSCMMMWLTCHEKGLKFSCTTTDVALRMSWENSPA